MALTKPAVGATGWGSSVNQNWTDIEAAFNSLCQGRLTLTSGTPVTTSNVSSASTLYFSPINGNWVGLYDGTNWSLNTFSELSLSLASLTSGKNYDVFLYNNSGTLTLILGPGWSTDTSRGTGAGTTELIVQDGIWVNKQDLSGGPTAKKGRYLGTIRTTGTTTTEDSDSRRYVWNCYNRAIRPLLAKDTTDQWSYTTNAWRAANANTTDGVGRVSFVNGLDLEAVTSRAQRMVYNGGAPVRASIGIGLDSTSATAAGELNNGASYTTASFEVTTADWTGYAGIGYHYIQTLERSEAAGTTSFFGDDSAYSGWIQGGLRAEVRS